MSAARGATRGGAATRRRASPDDSFKRIDPSLHDASEPDTLNAAASGAGGGAGEGGALADDRLSDFARQVIQREQDGDADEHDIDDGLFHPGDPEGLDKVDILGFDAVNAQFGVGPDGVLASTISAAAGAGGLEGEGHDGEVGAGASKQRSGSDGEEGGSDDERDRDGGSEPPNKRRRRALPPLGPGETRDPIQMKKDSHKEVERRRRETINDGILNIARLLPTANEKAGKGHILRMASEYLAELRNKVDELQGPGTADRIGIAMGNNVPAGAGAGADPVSGVGVGGSGAEGDLGPLKSQDVLRLERELAETHRQLDDANTRALTLETSWREADDRAAASGFEFERIKAELEDAKMRLLEMRR